MLSTLENASLGICTETCKERFSEGSTSQGVMSRFGFITDPGFWALVNKTNYRCGKLGLCSAGA